jgi:hypothetical protein
MERAPNTYERERPPERPDPRKNYKEIADGETYPRIDTPESREAIAHVRTVIERVDQQVLFDLFKEYYARVGNEPDSLALTSVRDVDIVYEPSMGRGWYSGLKRPTLNAFRLASLNDDRIISSLIHELTHEASATGIDENVYECVGRPDMVETECVQRSGVFEQRVIHTIDRTTGEVLSRDNLVRNEAVNEGITQIITDDILTEYTRRCGQGQASPERRAHKETGFLTNSYVNEQFTVRAYIAMLSVVTDIPEAVVKNAVMRTYFRNSSIAPLEVAEELGVEDRLPPKSFAYFLERRLNKEEFWDFVLTQSRMLSDEKGSRLRKRLEELTADEEKTDQMLYEDQT